MKIIFFFIEYLSCRNLSQEEYFQAKTRVLKLDQLKEDLVENFRQWRPTRQRTREKMEELASKLQEQHIRGSISTIFGASASTVGGILAIAGLITAPFTLGAGLVVSLVGAGIGGAGGLMMSVSRAVEIILARLGLREVQTAIDEDEEASKPLREQLFHLKKFISDLRGMESNGFEFLRNRAIREFTDSTEERIDLSAMFLRTSTSAVGAGAVAVAGAIARAGGVTGVRAAHIAGGVIGAVLLPLDIYMLVKSSLEVHRGSTSQAVDAIRERLQSEFKCPEENEIRELVQKFIEQNLDEVFNNGVSMFKRENGGD